MQVVSKDDEDGGNLTCKFVVVGVSTVGKSALVYRLTRGEWIGEHVTSTIGIDFGIVSVALKAQGKTVKCHIWDTAGQERFSSMSTAYMRGAHVVFYLFDPSDQQSIEGLKKEYLECARRSTINEGAFEALVGTKIDIHSPMKIPASLDTFEMPMYWVSSKTGENTQRLLQDACAHFYKMDAECTRRRQEQFTQHMTSDNCSTQKSCC